MKTAIAGIGAAIVASACCIGPVVFTLIGAGAASAASLAFVPYRPWFIGFTVVLIGATFYAAYRPTAPACEVDGTCSPHARRTGRGLAWIAAVAATLLIAFPYYIGWFVE